MALIARVTSMINAAPPANCINPPIATKPPTRSLPVGAGRGIVAQKPANVKLEILETTVYPVAPLGLSRILGQRLPKLPQDLRLKLSPKGVCPES
jgi:hypothetical protein